MYQSNVSAFKNINAARHSILTVFCTIKRLFCAALPLLFALDMGCKGFVGGTTPPPGPQIASVVDIPYQYDTNNTPQGGQGSCSSYFTTPQSQWQIIYTSGSSAVGSLVWPGGVGSPEYNEHYPQTLYYAFAPDLPANVQSDGQQAISEWNTVLQNNAPGQLLITLSQGQYGSPLTIYPQNDAPIRLESIGGGEVFEKFQLYNPVWTQAVIAVTSSRLSDVDYYNLIMHEIGHALGIDHNPYISSIMYPWEVKTCFNSIGSPPNAPADTAVIENLYDPTYVSHAAKCGPCNPCSGIKAPVSPLSCPQTKPAIRIAQTLPLFAGPLRPDGLGLPRAQTKGYENALSREIKQRQTSIWLNTSEDGGQRFISADDLYLGSPLIVELNIRNIISTLSDGGAYERMVVSASPLHVFKGKLQSADKYVVLINDKILASGDEIANDPPVMPGEHVLAFLIPNDARYDVQGRTTYSFVASQIAKYDIDSFGALHSPAGATLPASSAIEDLALNQFDSFFSQTTAQGGTSTATKVLARYKLHHRLGLSTAQLTRITQDPKLCWQIFIHSRAFISK